MPNPSDPHQPTDQTTTTTEQALKAALWHTIGRTIDHATASSNSDLNASPRFIGALSELCHAQIATVAQDLEAFARHAGRAGAVDGKSDGGVVIRVEDVLLLARRNEGLAGILEEEAKRVRGKDGG